ncbi:hypothetical protein MKK84_02515 [Methylobacterium sp. E-065]|uniref:AbiTii domain-containing protein n=1 Tax=Methylobacterium sp. E-065 TaxID=2836583 RepID=UPI001FBAF75D|nr:hypothetical protein [Methylobacterium sp. E-065]MCJ2016308.1 hypothetical protein [Methylobacterium sp. E-065]
MPTIVEQIQRDALDPGIQVSALLRRVKLAAAKLKLGAIEEWVQHELTGYSGKAPDYRTVHGIPSAYNPMRGMIPLQMDAQSASILSTMPCMEPVAVLEDLALRDDGQIVIRYPPKLQQKLRDGGSFPFPYYGIECGREQLMSVLDGIRNAVLDWAIELERVGILGSEFSFSTEERDRAKELAVTYNIGSIGNFTGNLGNGNISGDINSGTVDATGCANVIRQVARSVDQLVEDGVNADDLRQALNAASVEAEKGGANPSRLRAAMVDLRGVLSNAAGSLLASGAVEAITKLLS